jgi:preprotein translocase subunit SecE
VSAQDDPGKEQQVMRVAMADQDDSISGRARESVTGWWGRSRRFLTEVRNETGRVTWPSRKEVYATTIVVILTSIFFGVYLYGIDVVLDRIMGWVFRTFAA